MKRWIAISLSLVALAGCKKKDTAGEPSSGGAPGMSWLPADAHEAWEGAWVTRMHLQSDKKAYTTLAGDPVALEIKGTKVTAFGGDKDQQLALSFESPCSARFAETITEGSMKGGTSYTSKTFVVENGALVVGDGEVGYRKGKAAIACTSGDDVYLLDEKGTCTYWKKEFKDWQKWPDAKCTWSQKDGKDVLAIGEGDRADVLIATGDVLASESFRDDAKRGHHARAKDFADAKAQVTAKLAADDPGTRAKAKGGVAGKTETVLSLIATLTSDPSLKGKPIELSAQYLNSSSSTSGGKTTHNVMIVDGKDMTELAIPCELGETAPPEGLVPYDKVNVKGTVGEAFGKPELEGCTIAKAP